MTVNFSVRARLVVDVKYYEIWSQKINAGISWITLMGRNEFPSIKNNDKFDDMIRVGCFDSIPKNRMPKKFDQCSLGGPSSFEFILSFTTTVNGVFGRYGTNSIKEMLVEFLGSMVGPPMNAADLYGSTIDIIFKKGEREEYKYNNLSKRFSLVRTISNKKVKSTRTDVVIADDPMSGNESFGAPVSKENVEKLKKYFKENPVKNRLMIVAEDTLPVLGGNPEVLEEKTSLDGSDKYYTRSSDEPAILLYQSPEDFNVFFNGNTSLYLSRLPVEISVFDIISVSEYYSDGQLKGVYTNEEVSFFWTPDGETLGVLEVISSDFGRSNMFTVLIKKSGRQTQQEPEQKVITNEDRLRMVMKGLFKDGS